MTTSNGLVKWDNARQAISEAKNIDEVKNIIDKAEALRVYARQIGESLGVQNDVAEIKLRAQRRAGEMLKEMELKKNAGRPTNNSSQAARDFDGKSEKLSDIGISWSDSSRWQNIASLPEEKFEEIVTETKEEGKELTQTLMLGAQQKLERAAKIQEQREGIEKGTLKLPEGLYEVIVIDPPWKYQEDENFDAEGFRGLTPYPTMTLEEIENIKLPTNKDCVLWLWTTHRFMRHSFKLLDSWGFEEKAILTWVKNKMGIGKWLRSKSEFCIMAVKGKPLIELTNQTTILEANVGDHSAKPQVFYDMVDKLCIGRKLDYFARKTRNGWDSFGDEVKA